MPALTNPRQEAFCRYMSIGYNQTKAHEAAGYEGNHSSAGCLMGKRPEIQARITELLDERIAQKTGTDITSRMDMDRAKERLRAGDAIDPAWIIEQMMENIKLAREAGQFAAANKALELLGKEVGLFRDNNAKDAANVKDKEQAAAEKAKDSISVKQVNKLLERIGYDGPALDPQTLEPVGPDR